VQDDFTIICVFRASQGIGTGTQFYQGAGLVNGELPGVVNDFGMSLNANGKLLAGTGNPDITIVSSSSNYTNGQPHIVTFRRTRSTGALALFVDGVAQGTATGGTQSLTTPSQLVLGAQQTLINYLTGDIAEVKIYAAALSDADRVLEETALQCKYGLGSGNAPGTPTGTSAKPGDRRALLYWLPVLGASGYKVQWSANASGPFTQLTGNLATNSFVHTNAVIRQTNYYRVAAYSACGTGNYTSPIGVLISLPTLTFSDDANSLSLRWPSWAADWELYSTTNLNPPIIWSPVTNSISSSNGEFIIHLPSLRSAEFFRLTSP
jgi:hypothetical protein